MFCKKQESNGGTKRPLNPPPRQRSRRGRACGRARRGTRQWPLRGQSWAVFGGCFGTWTWQAVDESKVQTDREVQGPEGTTSVNSKQCWSTSMSSKDAWWLEGSGSNQSTVWGVMPISPGRSYFISPKYHREAEIGGCPRDNSSSLAHRSAKVQRLAK